jgi:hypothetical protein
MNRSTFYVSKKKLENLGLVLDSDLDTDIRETLELFTNINKHN